MPGFALCGAIYLSGPAVILISNARFSGWLKVGSGYGELYDSQALVCQADFLASYHRHLLSGHWASGSIGLVGLAALGCLFDRDELS
jgi:hypothetical protein